MEFFYEKVYAACGNKQFLINIYSVGKKAHKQIECKKECDCLKFLEELDNMIEKMESQETTSAERAKFIELAAKHVSLFTVFDQLNKKFGAEIYNFEENGFKTAVFSEVEKVKSYLNIVGKIEKLEGHLVVLQKSFL